MCIGCSDSAGRTCSDSELIMFTDNKGHRFAVDSFDVTAVSEYRVVGKTMTQIWVSARILFIVDAPPCAVVDRINEHRKSCALLKVRGS